MVITWLWWLALGASVPMLAAPLPVTIRHSSGRRIRFFRRPSVAVPWWAHLLGLACIPCRHRLKTDPLATGGFQGLSQHSW